MDKEGAQEAKGSKVRNINFKSQNFYFGFYD